MKVILIVDATIHTNKDLFEKHLKREGFTPIKGEEFAYEGEAHTHIFNTRAFILEVVSKALGKTDFGECKIIFQIGENPMEAYIFNKDKREFIEGKI
jgi:hypothetical protein